MGYTYELCRFLCGLTSEAVTDTVRNDVGMKTLDWLGCAVGALRLPAARSLMEVLSDVAGEKGCTAVGLGGKVPAPYAAFSNGAVGHALEYDDVNKVSITHPGAVVIPAAFAAAEKYDRTYEEYVLAVVSGYEAMIRLGASLNPSHYEYWHTTGTCGAFAAAAAAGKLLNLDTEGMQRAFGIAATMASGLVAVFGTDAKIVNVGNAAQNGLTAAELASKGFTAPTDVFERKKGYAQAASGPASVSFRGGALGKKLMIEDSYYKIHASCGHTHSALDALFSLMKTSDFKAEDVQKIEIRAYRKAVELTGEFRNASETEAKFSMPYCIAAGLLRGKVTLEEFSPELLHSPEVESLRKKIIVREDSDYTRLYPEKRKESVRILLPGRTLYQEVDLPDGKPTREFLVKKFRSLAERNLSEKKAENILHSVWSMTPETPVGELGEAITENCAI
ncbi:MmgE/PrpD family protein [Caproiciproducens sp. NJN-50]|uniref:MmgE/PrpD family protein n=1 Tax=Caproiciproducens sp. NJN-50 TaxID=2507162 RepID=UPI000FFE0CA0|nr:MmgE/PrpD family protein [Caproiciproducens sp. NJN-50]QAT48930.1 MmgE/PrpD family protein [Caproiciproducens sp. NJN-50]